MSEFRLLLLAIGIWVGASSAWPVPLPVSVPLVGLSLLLRRELVLVAGCCALAMSLGARADQAYQPVTPSGYAGTVQLITDVERWSFGSTFEARLADGRRVRVFVDGAVASEIGDAPVGSTFRVEARLRPLEEQPWLRARHLVGELQPSWVAWVAGPPWWQRPSEVLRSLVADGAAAFDPASQALYTGLVIGDDRDQSLAQQVRFRQAGLSHLLAVSGQNVAFALAVLWPFARCFGLAWRVVFVGVVLVVFALATRLEPSVVRATVTAGFAALAVLLGRPSSGVRVLCLTVSALVLVDPFLVASVGFRLSVAATAGILVFGPVLQARLPGPPTLTTTLAITFSAQVFVTPLLVSTFGPVSVVAIPANVLAGWAAGLVMVWGLSVGLVAGQVGGGEWLQWPVAWLLSWLDAVAVWASRVPAPQVGGHRSFVLAAACGLVAWLMWGRARRAVVGAAFLVVALLLWPGSSHRDEVLRLEGATLYPSHAGSMSVLVVSADGSGQLVEQLVGERISGLDLVVFERVGRSQQRMAGAVVEIVGPGLILAPPQHSLVGARRVTSTATVPAGAGILTLTPSGAVLAVDFSLGSTN